MQFFLGGEGGVQIRCIMGIVQVANSNSQLVYQSINNTCAKKGARIVPEWN